MGEILEFRRKEAKNEKENLRLRESDSSVKLGEKVNEEELIFLLDSLASLLRTVPGNIKSSSLFKKHLDTVSGYTDGEII